MTCATRFRVYILDRGAPAEGGGGSYGSKRSPSPIWRALLGDAGRKPMAPEHSPGEPMCKPLRLGRKEKLRCKDSCVSLTEDLFRTSPGHDTDLGNRRRRSIDRHSFMDKNSVIMKEHPSQGFTRHWFPFFWFKE